MSKIRFRRISMLACILSAGCQSFLTPGPAEATLQPTLPVDSTVFSVIVTVYPVEAITPVPTGYPEGTASFDPAVNAIISQVRNDLSQKTGVSLEKIRILEVEAVEWPDSSLGCGEPGAVYLPVITPGFRILLEVDGQIYSYHTNASNQFVHCARPQPIKINPTP